jgi:hypothetical protein
MNWDSAIKSYSEPGEFNTRFEYSDIVSGAAAESFALNKCAKDFGNYLNYAYSRYIIE